VKGPDYPAFEHPAGAIGAERLAGPGSTCQTPGVGAIDRAFERFLEKVIFGYIAHLPGRIVLAIAAALYAGVGLALPLGLGWSVPYLIDANFLGTTFAAMVLVGWLLVQLQARDRQHLVDWTTEIRHLNAVEFEWLVGEVFRRDGWTVEETGRQDGPDGNIDLKLSKAGERRLVQCKRWTSWEVGVDEVRKLAGTLLREGLAGGEGILVTHSNFTPQAVEEARQMGMALIDNRDLYVMVEQVRRQEPCPKCRSAMRLDRSTYGWWFHCTAAGCDGKRDLGRDPALAVDLLTKPQ
jgi:restriction system protein